MDSVNTFPPGMPVNDFPFCDKSDFAVGVSGLYDEVTPQIFANIFSLVAAKTASFSY